VNKGANVGRYAASDPPPHAGVYGNPGLGVRKRRNAHLQHNTRQPAAVNCVGDGPRATLVAVHTVTDQVSSVQVDYTEALLTDNEIIIHVAVAGDKTGPLGVKSDFGPKTNESGSITVPLRKPPQSGETVTVQFGLQTGAGCLPHPQIGLPGSRVVNGGQATFTSVKVG